MLLQFLLSLNLEMKCSEELIKQSSKILRKSLTIYTQQQLRVLLLKESSLKVYCAKYSTVHKWPLVKLTYIFEIEITEKSIYLSLPTYRGIFKRILEIFFNAEKTQLFLTFSIDKMSKSIRNLLTHDSVFLGILGENWRKSLPVRPSVFSVYTISRKRFIRFS